jgi:hypothetical protein
MSRLVGVHLPPQPPPPPPLPQPLLPQPLLLPLLMGAMVPFVCLPVGGLPWENTFSFEIMLYLIFPAKNKY